MLVKNILYKCLIYGISTTFYMNICIFSSCEENADFFNLCLHKCASSQQVARSARALLIFFLCDPQCCVVCHEERDSRELLCNGCMGIKI